MNYLRDRLYETFKFLDGYARTKDLTEAGITPYYIKKFVKEGYISRVKRGLYQYNDNDLLPDEEIIEVTQLIPKGVVCLLSAAAYHELSTINPWQYHIAIERSQKPPILPPYPPVQVYYFNKTAYIDGVEEKEIEGKLIKIYNMEKTICDLIRYRDKIGRDIMIECIKNYMSLPSRDINKLMSIAKKHRVEKKLKNFVEVLL